LSLNVTCKPFLRWAGGKKWLLKNINEYLPKSNFNQYHEPFIGGGAIFFHLQPNKSYISDLNENLIETYSSIKEDVENVITHLKTFRNTKEDYYQIRQKKFKASSKRAAQFIYLNQMSFNGIYRVNLKGEYNVPYGYRENYSFDFDNLLKVHNRLQNVNISYKDFYDILPNVKKNDLVFLDPPYTVTHNNNGFIQYNQKIFSIESQYKLAKMIKEIKEIGAFYILTNAAHPKVKEIFDNGDNMFEVSRSSSIGGKNAKRGKYAELIITNGVKK
jgi:DNA adenine methylase